jgi:hypothetical protein
MFIMMDQENSDSNRMLTAEEVELYRKVSETVVKIRNNFLARNMSNPANKVVKFFNDVLGLKLEKSDVHACKTGNPVGIVFRESFIEKLPEIAMAIENGGNPLMFERWEPGIGRSVSGAPSDVGVRMGGNKSRIGGSNPVGDILRLG